MLNGAVIRQARERLDLSQARLADALGVVELTVWRWENKPTKSLDYRTVRGLASALGVDEDSLFTHAEEVGTSPNGFGKPDRDAAAVVGDSRAPASPKG